MKKFLFASRLIRPLLLLYTVFFLSACAVQPTSNYDLGPALDKTAGNSQLTSQAEASQLYEQAPFVAKH